MRGKADMISGPKDNGVQTQTEPHSAKANTPQDESSKSVQDDEWEQVMSSIRKMAAKKGSTKRKEGENQDDFADLDLSQAGGEAGISKSSNKPNKNSLATDALGKDCIANNKPKDDRFQSWNQQKAKEAKPVSFNFLKSLDVDRAMTRAETSADKSPSERVNGASTRAEMQYKSMSDAVLSITPKDNSIQGWIQQRSKETKPVNFDFLTSPEANSASPQAKMQYKSPPKINEAIPRASSDNVRVPYSGYTVCIRNLPGPSNLALVKDALSIHGEVIGSFKKPGLNGSCAVYIEFKTAEAMDGALAARWLQLYSKAFTIVRADLPITTVVRLSKVNGETTESQLLSICGTYGSLDTIRRRGKGVYDVFYKVRELPNISKILDSLNEVTLNRSRWVALPAPTLHPSVRKEVLRSSEGQAWHVSQVNQTLNRIEVGLGTVSVCFEDLKALTSMEDELLKK